MQNSRLILYHQQAISARTLFVLLNERVCIFEPLPSTAQYHQGTDDAVVVAHPALILSQAEDFFGLAAGGLAIDKIFHEQVDTSEGPISVYLAHFTTVDAPYEVVAQAQGRFIPLTETPRYASTTELELLRRAYSVIMETV